MRSVWLAVLICAMVAVTANADCTYTFPIKAPTYNVAWMQSYSGAFTAGGTPPYVYSLETGHCGSCPYTGLPPGLTLSADGVLSGTPTVLGRFSFNIKAIDANGCAGYLFGYRLEVATQDRDSSGTPLPYATPSPKWTVGDFDGDHKTDYAVWRPNNGTFYILVDGYYIGVPRISYAEPWGLAGDKPVLGDFDGDGKTDCAIWRRMGGGVHDWYIINSADDSVTGEVWGIDGDIPVPGDYDGDGKTDIAVWRPSNGVWYVLYSSTNRLTGHFETWGVEGDIPAPGDYDGDGKTDYAIWRPSTQHWYILNSGTPGTATVRQGFLTDVFPVPGDYDGDGKTDMALYQPSTGRWYIVNSHDGSIRTEIWGGQPGDIPVPGDYNGAGATDLAVFRPILDPPNPSQGGWYVHTLEVVPGQLQWWQRAWGTSGDVPLMRMITSPSTP